MKTSFSVPALFGILVFCLFAIVGTDTAHATVGGPTFIQDFSYNPADESVYYQKISGDGRGCPPELMRLSLASGVTDKALSCDEGEALQETATAQNTSPVTTKIYDLTRSFKPLIPISLKKNDISVDIHFTGYENISPDVSEIQKANFVATAYQGNKKLLEFPIIGCSMGQPFSFAGYAVPGFEKKIVLLLSSKGDCWEGGYIRENLYVVSGVSNLDRTSSDTFHKYAAALTPSEGTLVVFAKNVASEGDGNTPTTPTGEPASSNTYILTLVGALIIGIGAGMMLGKVRK